MPPQASDIFVKLPVGLFLRNLACRDGIISRVTMFLASGEIKKRDFAVFTKTGSSLYTGFTLPQMRAMCSRPVYVDESRHIKRDALTLY